MPSIPSTQTKAKINCCIAEAEPNSRTAKAKPERVIEPRIRPEPACVVASPRVAEGFLARARRGGPGDRPDPRLAVARAREQRPGAARPAAAAGDLHRSRAGDL